MADYLEYVVDFFRLNGVSCFHLPASLDVFEWFLFIGTSAKLLFLSFVMHLMLHAC